MYINILNSSDCNYCGPTCKLDVGKPWSTTYNMCLMKHFTRFVRGDTEDAESEIEGGYTGNLGPMRPPCIPYEYTFRDSPWLQSQVPWGLPAYPTNTLVTILSGLKSLWYVVQAGGCYNRQLRIKQGMRYCSEGEFALLDALPGAWLPLDVYW